MRIQPPDIEVPEDDPFKNDLLGREETVKVLTHIVRSIEGPCVLSVDAAWGAGKTTFLKIWAQHLRNKGFPVVEFNAWETDFSEEPFIALSTELTEGLKEDADGPMKAKIDDMKEKVKEVARSLIHGLIRAAATGVPLVGSALGESLASLAEEKLNAYEEARKLIKTFRSTLQNMANTLSKSKEDRPLVLVIDELDRCRPSYAVELLEVAKHLFAADHVVFVLGVNRSELAHSVKALYGDEFDAWGYLGRFFDLDFHLPEPDRSEFISAMIREMGINKHLERTQERLPQQEASEFRSLLLAFFGTPDLSLRRVAQSIHRLGLVFASLRRTQFLFPGMTAVMFILRTMDLDLYRRFVDDEVSDLEVVDMVFKRPGIKPLKCTEAGDMFELMFIVATHERLQQITELGPEHSPLLERYHEMEMKYNDERRSGGETYSEGEEHAADFMRKVRNFHNRLSRHDSGKTGFKESVQRIELLSTVLMEPESSPLSYSANLSKATGSVNTQAPPKEPS